MRSGGRAVLATLVLSAAAVVTYLGYRALTLVPVPPVEPEPAVVLTPAETLPEFTLTNLAGEAQSITSWPGRALIINFWATWCPPCLREIPLLKEFQETNADKPLQVVGIAVDRFDPVLDFAEEMGFNYPVLIGQSEAMDAAAAFGVEFFGLPFSVFTDPEGRILGVHTGELHAEDLGNLLSVLSDLESGGADLDTARARLSGRM